MDGMKMRVGGAVAAALLLAGCASLAMGGRAPALRVDREVEAKALAFEGFTRRARGIDAGFEGPAEVSRGLQTGASYAPKELEAGLIAYAAMAALQEPKFVDAVRKAGAKPAARKELVRRLTARPDRSMEIANARLAAGRANAALYRQGDPLAASGGKVKKAAYSTQKQAWALAKSPDPAGRLAQVKKISAAGFSPAGGDMASLRQAVGEGGRRGTAASPAVARGVAVAALTVLGEGQKGRALLSEAKSGMCLRVAKLNLYQCLASAGPYYEDIYCLGEHAMIEPGQCVLAAADPARRQQRASLGR